MFETDDDDFIFSPNSKLSSIFNTTSNSEGPSASLTYKAPTQPKPLDSRKALEPETNVENRNQTQTSVILAKVISLWTSDDGKNKAMGKYMVAIIANPTNDVFDMIIYQEKTKILIRETLGISLKFRKCPNNFVAFCDKHKQPWNLHFDSTDNRDLFLHHINKYNCVIFDSEQNKDETDYTAIVNESKSTPRETNLNATNKELSSKEKILSRITKMGQPILPRMVQKTRSSDLSDSETESSISDSKPTKPVTAPRKFKRNVSNHEKALTPMLPDNHVNFAPHISSNNNNLILPNNQMVLNPHTAGLVYSQPMPDYGLSNFIIAQNAELKANLTEISVKLNNVLSSSDNNGNNKTDVNNLNTKIKCQNLKIDNLSTDLERSRSALEELRKKYDVKCDELVKQEQAESTELELNALRDKVKYVGTLQNEIVQAKEELKEKDKLIEIQTLKLKDFENYFKTTESFKEENNNLKKKLEESSLKIIEYEEEIKRQQNESSVKDQSLKLDKDSINKLIRESMNEAFINIMDNFDDNEAYGFKRIQAVLLENLKETSYRLVNSLLEP